MLGPLAHELLDREDPTLLRQGVALDAGKELGDIHAQICSRAS
jgi:hypothetical protein